MELKLATGKPIPLKEGESILHALWRQEIYLTASCGGKGTCGKCKVRLKEGKPEVRSRAKLTEEEIEGGLVLACQAYPRGDVSIEIPEGSRLVVGQRIAVSATTDLAAYLPEGKGISPLVSRLDLKLPPPTLDDNISDLERLRRALSESDLGGMRFSQDFVSGMGRALRKAGWDIHLDYAGGPEAVRVCSKKEGARYGLAVDIGTTTVVVYMVDLSDGAIVDVGLTYNSQMRWGDDVITRIVHATEGGGLEELRKAVVSDINDLASVLTRKHGIEREAVESASVSGNTTMTQLFWGLDPGTIREEPYIPTLNAYPLWQARGAALKMHPRGPVYTVPAVASYVGGDIVSGVLVSRMARSDELALFMDIGTNGEIALGNREWLVTAAASAGPCFEGSGIRHGMRATDGAVEKVKIDPESYEPRVSVIGGVEPAGICGSGMIDAISEMFLTGVIDQKGKLRRGIDTWRVVEGTEGLEYVIHKNGGAVVSLTEVDIENILRAKAAIYAAVSLLVSEVGMGISDIQRVYIAGGFGNYIDIERAVVLGMLPDLPVERFQFLGNTSVAGAYLTLLSEDLRAEAEDIASKMTYMELSVSGRFMDEYMSALFLPHTDLGRFPSVEKILRK
ncbi:MAG: ASKHA domain-containing protein [Nitrospirota bacterium]